MGIKQIIPKSTNCRWSDSKDIQAFKRFHFDLFSGSHASFPSSILIIKTSSDVISTATTNIPRIFELNLSRLLVWITALVRYFSMIFSYAQKRSCGQPGTELSPAYSEMPTFMLGSHILTIRNEIKLLLQLPTPGPCSFHPLPFSRPFCSRPALSLTLGWHNMGLVFVAKEFLKLTTDLPPPPAREGEPKKRGPAPGFPLLCAAPWQTPSPANLSRTTRPTTTSTRARRAQAREGRLGTFTSRYTCPCKKIHNLQWQHWVLPSLPTCIGWLIIVLGGLGYLQKLQDNPWDFTTSTLLLFNGNLFLLSYFNMVEYVLADSISDSSSGSPSLPACSCTCFKGSLSFLKAHFFF